MKLRLIVLGVLLAGLGTMCVHYNSAEDRIHHAQWAEERGLPAPAAWIARLGWVFIGGGVIAVGYATTRKAPPAS